ncbi:Protein transport protein sec9, partial [Termitomyces sp. T112]
PSTLYNPPSSRSAYPTEDSSRDKYSRSNGVGDVYSRGTAEIEKDRNELFAGYKPQKSGSGRFFDGPQSGRPEPNPGEENDEDIEGIKQQTRFTKQESVSSTRNALRMAREAEETARNTLTRLGDQSEKLANTERHLDVAKGHSARAEDNTNELKQLNRSIFRPVIVFNKEAKRAAQEAKVQARYDDEREEREKTMMDIRETQNRLGRAATYGRGDDEELIGSGVRARFKTAEQQAISKEQRRRYQFEATASDDELEDELDTNLDEISEVSKRLKALGMAMGSELDNQNSRIDRIEGKAVRVEQKLHMNTQRLKNIK